jgi:hypothetical protein
METIHAIPALRDGEKGFAIPALRAGHQHDVAVPLDGTHVEDAVDAHPGHQMRIVGVIEIITPEQRCVFGGQDGKFVPVKNAVALLLLAVRPLQEFPVLQLQLP